MIDWRAVVATANSQAGLIHLSQLRERGVSHPAIRRAVAAGRLERCHRGVFCLPGAPRSWERAAHEALLLCGTGSVLSHASAARVWRFDGFQQ
ncbi:MAG: type IV toxin-antitoxin system AbiEi family antitoxin domain-containing protein [Myxococcota bacterium]